MEGYPRSLGVLLWCALIYLVLRPSFCHPFACLDTVALCQCDPTKLALNCSHLGLRDVPLADIPNETSSLGLGDNSLTSLTESTFASLTSLLRLSLSNNHIVLVAPLAFNASKDLRYLDLSGNRLATVPAALSVLTSLTVLNMSRNELAYLSGDDFLSLTKLETLRLEYNALHSIPDTVFHPLPDLYLLYLDGNFISADPVGWFVNSTHLTQLSLSGNLLDLAGDVQTWFAADLLSLPLKELYLDDNVIPQVTDTSLRACFVLEKLHLASNKIASIAPDAFSDLVNLQTLTLAGNMLSGSLPDNLFVRTVGLRTLSLEDNSLSVITRHAFNGLDLLQELNMAKNKLEEIFTCDSDCTEDETNLLPALSSLNLESNSLTSVPMVGNFTNLELLDLSTNRIAYLESYAFNGTSMQWVFLHDNLLTTMSSANFEFLPSLLAVSITGNSWVCDCRLFWIVDPDVQGLGWMTAVHDDVVCQAPDSAKGMDLDTLNFLGDKRGENGPFAACETADWVTIVVICVVWVVGFLIFLVWYLCRTINYQKGYVGRTVKAKADRTSPVCRPLTPPHPMAHLNQAATFDELDKSATTETTLVLNPQKGEQTPEAQGNDEEQAMCHTEIPESSNMPVVISTV